ncbi:hypothetical protein ACOSQ3_020706 [Xanthoceras sorbifolium]
MYGDDEAKQMRKGVKDLLFRLYDFYSALDTSSGIKASNDVQLSSGKDVKKKRYRNIYEEKMEEGFLKYLEEHGNRVITHEVDQYLLYASENPRNDKFDTLTWWKLNATRYPILSHIAKDVFAIPVQTIASECAFSIERRTLDPFRSSLSPKIVEALICTQDWLQSSIVSDNNESCTEEIEFLELLESEFLGSTSTADCMIAD